MADRAINELIEATQMLPADLFVLQQDGQAKKLSGQTFTNFLTKLADGHGGIASIIKTKTSGLVDTYTITLADRSASTFTVTNGAKGDTGAQTYVWIKYASINPESYPHSFGDLPAPWIGIYTGLKSSAPTLWSEYTWFKIKGEKGETGNPATIKSKEVVYQASESGTAIPGGSWLSAPPSVPAGWYLWTRVTVTYNTGSPVVSYSVGYHGINGTGSVNSVANVQPDPSGNIPLTAANIGAATPEQVSKAVIAERSIFASNLQVPTSAWKTYSPSGEKEQELYNSGKTCRASVAIIGATTNMIPYLTLDEIQVEAAGIGVVNRFRCYDGGVLLYADGVASAPITILTAELRKVVA